MAHIVLTTVKTFAYGASRMNAHYVDALVNAGHEVTVLYEQPSDPNERGGSILPELKASGASIRMQPGLRFAFAPMLGRSLETVLRSLAPDLVMSTQLGDAPATMKAAERLGLPRLMFVQNMSRFTGRWPIRPLKRAVYAAAARRADRIVVVAPSIRDELVANFGVPDKRVAVVCNGFDMDAAPPHDPTARDAIRSEFGVPDDAFVLVNLARIHPQKRLDVLVDAVAILDQDDAAPPVHCIVAGDIGSEADRPLKESLEKQIADHGLDGRFHLAGFRKDGPRLLQAADLFTLSSDWEGLPLAILESFEARTPVVMTEYGTRFAGFEDGVHGWYVPIQDPNALAASVKDALLLSKEEREAIADAARTYLENNLTLAAGKERFVTEVETLLANVPSKSESTREVVSL